MKKKNKKLTVYSTNPNFEYNEENDENLPIHPSDQLLEVWIDKHRAGKTAVIIKGFIGDLSELKALSKKLKTKCGVGGSVKNGEIIIQGNIRDKVIDILGKEGYNYIANLFEETAMNEIQHAKDEFKFLGELGDTKKNLQSAVDGEHYEEAEMYPKMAAEAREEGAITSTYIMQDW